MPTAVSIEHVFKRYRLGSIRAGTIAEDFASWLARLRGRPDPLQKVPDGAGPRQVGDHFWALSDVTLEIKEGEVIGLIGRNGAGKSTLLKVLSQLTAPTAGRVQLRGRVASLLEVGTGFHPDLTGRENVFLNGAIMGMTKAEIRRKFDEIVNFSECEAFIDTPVKRYSSGMYVRLAFAVAAHLEPEILIVDEVLAVGDAQFQRKCLGKMSDVARHGRTIIFVSHSMTAVASLCTRAVLFSHGRLVAQGDVRNVCERYQSEQKVADSRDLQQDRSVGSGRGRFTGCELRAIDAAGAPAEVARPGSDLDLILHVRGVTGFLDATVSAVVFDAEGGRVIDLDLAANGEFVSLRPAEEAVVRFRLHDVLLKPGVYRFDLWLGRRGVEEIDRVDAATELLVQEPLSHQAVQVLQAVYQCRYDCAVELQDQRRGQEPAALGQSRT